MKSTVLAVVLAITGCSSAQFRSSRVDPALAALVPADSVMLVGFRMADVRATPIYAKLIAQQRLSDLDDFARRTNFDPRKDVNEMLVASDSVNTVVLARGNFKPRAPDELKKSPYKGTTIYGDREGSFAILDSATAVAGPEAAVRKAIDQKQSGRPGPVALLDRARALPAEGQIWVVSSGWGTLPDRIAGEGGNIGNMSRVLRTLDSVTGTVDLRAGITARVNGSCRTDQDAKTMADAIRGMIGLGRLSVPENQPEMLRLFDGIKVEQQQQSIQFTAQIPADLVDRLLTIASPSGTVPKK